MFNLFGAEVPVPLANLSFEEVELPVKEKLAWEKELMGVYLSEHPFTPYASKVADENITLCGQIEAEMNGQTVQVAGMVASVARLVTKAGKLFVKAVLEDLEGSVEVMVWSDVYTETVDLWEEGTIVLVEGRVSVRDDEIQVSCKRASRYQPGQTLPKKTQTVPETKPTVVSNGKAAYVSKPGNNGKPVVTAPPGRHRLVVSLNGTPDEEGDKLRLHKVIFAVREYQGRDEVSLRIVNNGKTVNLKLPNIYTGYCQDLHDKLVGLVGTGGLKIETLTDEA
jgi:DNA polymerase-3 subunit alpha